MRWTRLRHPHTLPALQLWFEMYHPPTEREVSMLEEVLTAWFLIGRLGGFDATNLQVRQSCTLLCIARCTSCSS